MKGRKRLLAGLFFVALLLYNGNGAQAESASAAILIEAETGRILYEKNAHTALPMASTTKVMTALVALEHAELSETVTAGKNAFGVPGTSIYLQEGEQLSMEEMLLGLMLQSGNDAAVAIAEHVGGSVENFCSLMTLKAEQIGCENTIFATPHGLPASNHHTTAYDLALICREAMKNPDFRRIVSTQRASIPWAGHTGNRILNNKNKLLSTYEGSLGIKTGYTRAAGRCLCFAAERNGMTVIGCVLNAPNWFDDAREIMDRGFDTYEMRTLLEESETLRALPVEKGVEEAVAIRVQKTLSAPMPKGTWPELIIDLPDSLPAGVEKGQAVGTASLMENGNVLCTTVLYAAENVPAASFRTHITRLFDQWLLP